VPINKITASCTGLACRDPHGCTVPGVAFGSHSLALSLAWLRGSCTQLWVGGSSDTTTVRLEGEKRKKMFSNTDIKYVTALGFRMREQSVLDISFSHSHHPWAWGQLPGAHGIPAGIKRGWVRAFSSECSCMAEQEAVRSENTSGPRSWF